jgi:hypothetical protein
MACSEHKYPSVPSASVATDPAPVPEAPASKAEPTLFEKMRDVPTLSAAVAATSDMAADSVNKLSPMTIALTAWGLSHMKLADVAVKRNETSFALVRKDSDETRGKRMCVSGLIIEIAVEKTSYGKVNQGLLMSGQGDLYHFSTTGSSGELVEKSRARLCGVTTGNYEYSNSGGGTGHAIQIVGMFDLPQNGGRLPRRELDDSEVADY